MTRAPFEVRLDEGWRALDLDDPRCPCCGAALDVTEIIIEGVDHGVEHGRYYVYCTAHPDEHLDDGLQYRCPAEGTPVYDSIEALAADSEITGYELSPDGLCDAAVAVRSFRIPDDPDFRLDYDAFSPSGYVVGYWGDAPFLLRTGIDIPESWIRYEWCESRGLYVSDGTIYPSWDAAERGREGA